MAQRSFVARDASSVVTGAADPGPVVFSGAVDEGRGTGWLERAAALTPALVALSVILAGGRAWFSHTPWMIFFEDDFFYYLKIAQNLADGHGSTFNGLVATNGYHPLWLLLLTALSWFTKAPWAIFLFVVTATFASTMATFYLARRMLASAGVTYALRQGLAAYVAIYALHLFYTGMEVILAVPAMFAVLVVAERRSFWQRGFWPALGLGLLCSVMILSRLDLMLLTAMLAGAALLNGEVRRSLDRQQVAGLLLGLLPVAVYVAVNHFEFGTWLPVSGMAKQLKFNHLPSLRPWKVTYVYNLTNRWKLVLVHVAMIVLVLTWKRLTTVQRVLFPTILLFPFVYIFLLSCVSDWLLWLWYYYPLRAALCVSFIVFWIWPATGRLMRSKAFALLMLLVIVGEVAVSSWWTDIQPPLYAVAMDLADFAKTHPGTYAMGDRSGMVAYLLPYPLVQTEGLVMDRAYLDRIRRQEPLVQALRQMGVRYYVGTAWKPYTGCFHAVEPYQAGKTSAHMEGDFCAPPVARFEHSLLQTMVFEVEREH